MAQLAKRRLEAAAAQQLVMGQPCKLQRADSIRLEVLAELASAQPARLQLAPCSP